MICGIGFTKFNRLTPSASEQRFKGNLTYLKNLIDLIILKYLYQVPSMAR